MFLLALTIFIMTHSNHRTIRFKANGMKITSRDRRIGAHFNFTGYSQVKKDIFSW